MRRTTPIGRVGARLLFGSLSLLTAIAASAAADVAAAAAESAAEPRPLFRRLPSSQTGVTFANRLSEDAERNVLRYQYFYNGGGVAVGDVDGDGRVDIYLTANQGPNRLYLNQGGMRFRDAGFEAGVAGRPDEWSTGAAMVDVDGDGDLDIYLSRSGRFDRERRANALFLNDGKGRFSEAAARFGLDDRGQGTQATFFDLEGDGDLDAYVLNHGIDPIDGGSDDLETFRTRRDADAGDRLYRNDGGRFHDVSEAAGIAGSALGFGLSVAVSDFDGDSRPDLYVANDFLERDFLYLQRGDGSFREVGREALGHISQFSMGSDVADIDGDGLPDLFVADMAPADNYRQKTMMQSMSIERFRRYVAHGFHHQYMFNTLQRSNGDGSFSEIAQLAGVARSDWSWAPLFADFDNDGHVDLFITTGRRKNASNVDFRRMKEAVATATAGAPDDQALRHLLAVIPRDDLANEAFRNLGDLNFEPVADAWGLAERGTSSGAAYADLDGDGDLDLVVNNVDDEASVYENTTADKHHLRVRLIGKGANTWGIGARVRARVGKRWMLREQFPARGYQSSVDPTLHFGLGDASGVDELRVEWPSGAVQTLRAVPGDQLLTLRETDAAPRREPDRSPEPRFVERSEERGLKFLHRENDFDDFEREILLPHRMSRLGPALAAGDVDGDGNDDLFFGGAAGFAATLFVQRGEALEAIDGPWQDDATHEDVGAVFFDADDDGDLDLYVASGGNEQDEDSPELQDRLYRNDGQGKFTRGELPRIRSSGAALAPGDFDGDGDLDLFVGGRQAPGRYPWPPRSQLLRNDGGRFVDVTRESAPELAEAGMVTAATWADIDGDTDLDLIVVGEWMPVRVLENAGGRLRDRSVQWGLARSDGWWMSVAASDLDGDGDTDFVLGNVGLNYKHRASDDAPLSIYANDFDRDQRGDIVLSYRQGEAEYPARGRECSSQQMPAIATAFPTYDAFAKATLGDVYGESLDTSLHLQARTFASVTLLNEGGRFVIRELPRLAQISAIRGILSDDFDGDGHTDLLVAGNFYDTEVETPRLDGSHGLWLRGTGQGAFAAVPLGESGFSAPGNVIGLATLRRRDGSPLFVVARNSGRASLFELRR